ncbi:MAG: MFS transporter, partial [Chloroflexi bacterium]|nr:MFS transporter [Chloroflexota bacterium]
MLAAGTFVLFLTWGGHYSFGVFLLPLTLSLDASRGAVSALISIRGVFSGTSSILFGALADKYGPKRIITLGVIVTGLAWVISARSSRLWELYLFFSLMGGLGMGAIYVPILSVVSRWFNRRRALALGILLCSFGVSQTLLPPVFSRLTERFGWESVFGVVGLTILAGGVPAALVVRRDPRESGLFPDGKAGGDLEGDYQQRERDSWTLKETMGSRTFWQLFVIYFSCAFCFQIVIFHIVARAVDAGVAAGAAALVVSFAGGSSVVGRVG